MKIDARLRWIIRRCEEQIAVAESWADNRPEEEPPDCEPERIIVQKATKALTAFRAGFMDQFNKAWRDLVNYSKRIVAEDNERKGTADGEV